MVRAPASTELLVALDALTSARRARGAAAAREIPVLYVVTLVTSGLALIANAGALALRASPRTSLLVLRRLASVVGLSLALLFSLTAPWRGPLTVSGQPIDAIVHDLQTGFFDGCVLEPRFNDVRALSPYATLESPGVAPPSVDSTEAWERAGRIASRSPAARDVAG